MKLSLTALTLVATMFANSASAFDPEDLQKLKDTGGCPFCDLGGVEISSQDRLNTNLIADLTGANLQFSDLTNASLHAAELGKANLSGADLKRAILRLAVLIGADLRGADLRGADLTDAFLRDTDLSAANLRDADLRGAQMNGVILCNTIMPDGSVIYSGC